MRLRPIIAGLAIMAIVWLVIFAACLGKGELPLQAALSTCIILLIAGAFGAIIYAILAWGDR